VVKRSPFLSMLAAGMLGGGVTAAALLGTGVAGDDGARTVITSSSLGGVSTQSSDRQAALTAREIYQRDGPGVAFVRARSLQGGTSPFDLQPRTENVATGSAFVIDGKGRLLTNAHVVAGATDIRVTFSGDRTVPAQVLGKDEDSDLALLSVDPKGLDLKPLELGSSSSVQVGDPTVAIGNPFGLDRTLTTGVISAKQRRITAPSGFSIDNVIQTDAAINPGNSGGPLIDAGGRVIGINSQIATATGGTGSVGIGFAVPIDTAKAAIPDLVSHHMVSHAYLGMRANDPGALVALDDGGKAGVRVEQVDPDGPAARAGILGDGSVAGGDVILLVDGVPVHSMADIDDVVARHRPGDGIAVVVQRDGIRRTVQVMLAERPAAVPIG
jgi:S1-C subfamily serine protease